MKMDIDALKSELTTDPAGLGYTGTANAKTTLINDETFDLDYESLPPSQVVGAIDPTEFKTAPNGVKDWVALVFSPDVVSLTASIKTGLSDLGSSTATALALITTRKVSRAAILGLGKVRVGHVQEALR